MKALTLTQPWATLVAIGAKNIETRAWSTEHRGQLAIHAAKGFPDEAREIVREEPFQSALRAGLGRDVVLATDLPVGSIIAVANLVQVFRFDDATEDKICARSAKGTLPPNEVHFGDFTAGRAGLVLECPVALPQPVPARGMLGLWDVPSDIAARVIEQLAAIEATV